MPSVQRETFSFDPAKHSELCQWLASHPSGWRSQAIVEALDARARIPDHIQIMAELRTIRELVKALPGKLGASEETPYEPR